MSVIKVDDIAYVRFSAPDLGVMKAFLEDFGLIEAEDVGDGALRMRGTGSNPFVHETILGDPGFAGLGLRATSVDQLHVLAAHEGVSVEELKTPGGGYGISLTDPDGFQVDVIAGQREAPVITEASQEWNHATIRSRPREIRGPAVVSGKSTGIDAPSTVARLGHVVLEVADLKQSEEWWRSRLGFLMSDEILAQGAVPIVAFMRCDRGEELADHHTLALFQAKEEASFNHVAFEVRDFDDLMAGHDHLKSKGRKSIWGVGRHTLGSQIFDYWADPWGHRLEHWTDGDFFTADDKPNQVGAETLGSRWGPPLPANF